MVRVACVIPALDAARTLASVIHGMRSAVPGVRVVVIDDGSRDGTAAVASACADQVIRFRHNRGKGVALRAGFAALQALDAATIVTLDADGQHDPASAPRLIQALERADIAIGIRARRGTPMPLHRRVGNAVSALAVSACARRWLSDSQSGYRAFRTSVLRTVSASGDRYEYETDFLIQAARAGCGIASVPVPTIYGARSHFRGVRDTVRVARTICAGLAAVRGPLVPAWPAVAE